jgi:hypothetical protein
LAAVAAPTPVQGLLVWRVVLVVVVGVSMLVEQEPLDRDMLVQMVFITVVQLHHNIPVLGAVVLVELEQREAIPMVVMVELDYNM